MNFLAALFAGFAVGVFMAQGQAGEACLAISIGLAVMDKIFKETN